MLHSVKDRSPQTASWRVHIDAMHVRKLILLLQQCRRQRAKLAADSNDKEPLFSHASQITEATCRQSVRPVSSQLWRNSCA
ncbi:MAG: hypothetical protein EB111_06615, partial [Actinobacteria bacterium]|nr:hypothetical protein [Actinomycetota bacterium]